MEQVVGCYEQGNGPLSSTDCGEIDRNIDRLWRRALLYTFNRQYRIVQRYRKIT